MHDGINYLLFRVYEAAKQLARVDGRRIAIAAIQYRGWHGFEIGLIEDQINWNKPQFVTGQEGNLGPFLNPKLKEDPQLEQKVAATIGKIDEVWILRQTDDHEFHPEYPFPVRGS